MPCAKHGFGCAVMILVFISTIYVYCGVQLSIGNACVSGDRIPTETEPGPRILCWILTGVPNHMKRAIHVKRTWGSRCDILLFMSSQQDERLGTISLPGTGEGHDKLWPKTVAAFEYVWEHHKDDAEWFLKADDDTWVFTNNLRSFLNSHDPNAPHYFGCHYDSENGVGPTYNLGGMGYVVSKETLRRFIEESLPDPKKCHIGIGPLHLNEDEEFGACLQSIGILPGNTKDMKGRARFVPIDVANYVRKTWKKKEEWKQRLFWMQDFSDQPISFHGVRPEYMYMLEYLTSYLKLDAP